MQYYLEDKDIYVDIDDSVPSSEAMRQIQDNIYGIEKDVNGVAEVGKAFSRSLINSASIASLAIADIGDSMQSEPLKTVAGNVGRGAHLTNINNAKDFSLYGFGSIGNEFYREGFKEYQDDSLTDFITSMGSKISKGGNDVTDKIAAFADQVAPSDPSVFNGDFMKNPSWTRAASAVTSAVPSLAMAMTAAMVTKNPMAAATLLGGFEGLQAKKAAQEDGVELDQSRAIGSLVGIGSTIMEGMSLGFFFNKLKGAGGSIGRVARGVVEGMTVEGLEEGSQQLWNNLVAKLGYDKSRNLMEGVVESVIAGAGSGGAIGGLAGGFGGEMDTAIKQAKDMGATQEEIDNAFDVATVDMVNNSGVVEEAVNEKVRELDKNNESEDPTHEKIANEDLDILDEKELSALAAESVLNGDVKKGSFAYSANRETMHNIKQQGLGYAFRTARLDRIFSMFDGFKDGVFTKKVWKPIAKATFAKQELYGNYIKKLSEINKLPLSLKSHTRVVGKHQGINVTEDTAMFVYANSLNKDNVSKLKSSGLSQEDIGKIVGMLSKEGRKAVLDTVDYFSQQMYGDISKTYKELNGKDLKKLKNYFPIRNLEDAGSTQAIEVDIAQRFDPAFVRKEIGAVKERVGGKEGFRNFSFYDTITKHANDAAHYVTHAKQVKDASNILSNRKVKSAIRQKYGNELVGAVDRWIEDVSFGGSIKAQKSLNKIARFLRTNFVTAVLGYNLNTVLKQPISFLQGMNAIGEKQALDGVTRFVSDIRGSIKFVKSRSTMMRHRGFTQERELNEIMKGRKSTEILGNKNVYRMVKDGGMKPIMWADQATTTSLWLGAYHDKIAQGVNESDAVDYADEIIQKTQPMGGVTFLPDDFRGDALQQLFTTFRNQSNQNLNILFEETGEVLAKKNATIGDYLKVGKGYAYMMLVGGFIIGLVSRKRFPKPIEFANDALSMPLRGTILLGDVVSGVLNSISGNSFYAQRSLMSPGFSSLANLYTALAAKNDATKMKYFTKLMFELTGTPYAPVKLFTKPSKKKNKVI